MPYVLGFFTNLGAPNTGLTPTINIRRVDTDALVVTGASMSEIGDGWYKYDFTTFDGTLDYVILMDAGGSARKAERYIAANNDSIIQETVVDGSVTVQQLLQTLLARFVGQADVTEVGGEKVVTYLQQDDVTTQHQTTTNAAETQRRTTVDPA